MSSVVQMLREKYIYQRSSKHKTLSIGNNLKILIMIVKATNWYCHNYI